MTSDSKHFQELITAHQPLVHSLATRIHRQLPPYIRLEDVICYGQLGLAQAARSYQPETGSAFSTFAYYRIRGAIYDGVSKMSGTSRSAWQRIKAEQRAAEVIEAGGQQQLLELPDAEAESRWLANTSGQLAVVYLLSAADSDDQSADGLLEDRRSLGPDEQAEQRELHQLLYRSLESLPELERSLMVKIYFEDMSLAQASEQLGHSRSWGCRTHARVLARLGRALNAQQTT